MQPSSSWALSDWLSCLETLHPTEIDLGLARIHKVAQRLGISKGLAKVVTVAGTNGKGSCVAVLETLLLESKENPGASDEGSLGEDISCKVGTFTSPHILRYNERIKINGVEATDEAICSAFMEVERARKEISLTYFEFGTLAALCLFQEAQLDYWILEVGLGGRLDAVNIIEPDIAVITSIDLDHTAWLGETREEIAIEKLGILRKQIPCVCAENDLTESMQSIFAEMETKLYLLGREFQYDADLNNVEVVDFRQKRKQFHFANTTLPMTSLAAATQVLALLDELPRHLQQENTINTELRLTGRWDVRQLDGVDFVLDVAHNPEACRNLFEQINAKIVAKKSARKIIAFVAMMKDKNIREALAPLADLFDAWYVCQIEGVARSATSDNLQSVLLSLNVASEKINCFLSVDTAFSSLRGMLNDEKEGVSVVVFGSFYTVAEVLECIDMHRDTNGA